MSVSLSASLSESVSHALCQSDCLSVCPCVNLKRKSYISLYIYCQRVYKDSVPRLSATVHHPTGISTHSLSLLTSIVSLSVLIVTFSICLVVSFDLQLSSISLSIFPSYSAVTPICTWNSSIIVFRTIATVSVTSNWVHTLTKVRLNMAPSLSLSFFFLTLKCHHQYRRLRSVLLRSRNEWTKL